MGKKKSLLISIILVILLIITVATATYAYLATVTNEEGVGAGSGILDINYTKPANLTGNFIPSTSRVGGLTTSAKASLKTDSESALFNMYLTPTSLTNLNITALKWEVEGIRDGSIVCSGSGDFSQAIVNTPITIINKCALSKTETTFNIYVWLDSNLIQGAVGGVNFGAKIGADSIPITGEF